MTITPVTTRVLRTPADNPLVVGLPAPTDTREFVTLELGTDQGLEQELTSWLRLEIDMEVVLMTGKCPGEPGQHRPFVLSLVGVPPVGVPGKLPRREIADGKDRSAPEGAWHRPASSAARCRQLHPGRQGRRDPVRRRDDRDDR